jgi:hypothetical protein
MTDDEKQYNFENEFKLDSKYALDDDFALSNFQTDSKVQNNEKAIRYILDSKKLVDEEKVSENPKNLKEKIKKLLSDIDKFKSSLEQIKDVSDVSDKSQQENFSSGIDKQELEKRMNSLKKEYNDKLIDVENKYRKIFVNKQSKKESKEKKKIEPEIINVNKLSFYSKISRWPSIFIILFSVLIVLQKYFISDISGFRDLNLYKWPFEIIIFIITSYYIIKKKNQLPRLAGGACTFIGFQSGVLIALIKLIWYGQMWNIFYLSLEALFLALTGFVIGLVSSAIFFENKVYKS